MNRNSVSILLKNESSFSFIQDCINTRSQESKLLLEQFPGVTVTIGDAMDESSIQKVLRIIYMQK